MGGESGEEKDGIYLFITTQQKDQRPLTLSVKAQEAKSTCNTQSTKHREIETKK